MPLCTRVRPQCFELDGDKYRYDCPDCILASYLTLVVCQVSETLLESPDPATRGPGIGIPGAFLDARRSIEIDMNSFFATDDPDTLEDESATKVPRIAFDGQHESHSGS